MFVCKSADRANCVVPTALAVFAFLLQPLLAPPASAQTAPSDEAPILDDEIVVTATRSEEKPAEVGSSVTVLTRTEIELRAKTHVADLLRTVPGVGVVRGGGPGQVTSVFVRGGSSSQTLVLLDGLRVNDPSTGGFDFANLTTDQIERIEIVRGPQSTLYGSEAMAGVIQIFTRRGESGAAGGLAVQGLVEAGDDDQQRLRLALEGAGPKADWRVTVSDQQTDGVSAASERRGNLEVDPAENTSVTAQLGFATGAEGRLDLTVRSFDAEVANDGFDFLLGPVDDLDALQFRDGNLASLRWSGQLSSIWRQTVTLAWMEDTLRGEDPTTFFSNFRVDSERLEIGLESDVDLGEHSVLTLGVSSEEREGASVGNFDESVDVTSVYVQQAWSGDRLHLTAGGRWDDHSQFGDETTYRLAASWQASTSTRIHGSWGTGFKAPTLNDLYFPFFSNPDLVPETSTAFDLGVEGTWLADRLRIDLTFFDTDFEDLIVFDFATFLPQNLAEAEASGAELTVEWRPGAKLQVLASHTWLDSEDLASSLPLPRRAEQTTTLQLFFKPIERLTGTASLVLARDRFDTGGVPMDDSERVDLALHYRVRPGLVPYLRVENLFDEDYEEVPGFTTPGATAALGLAFGF